MQQPEAGRRLAGVAPRPAGCGEDRLEVGLALFTMQSTARAPANHARLYAELVEDARRAEALGYDSIWFAEHRFWYDGWCPAPFVAAAAAAAATTTLRFGTGMLLLPQHDALHLAETVAVLDRISGGRVDLGVGLGHRDAEFDGLGLRRDQRGARMEDGLEILLRAFSGERFAYQGRVASASSGGTVPTPLQSPHPPIWLGGMADEALARGVRHGCSYLLPQTLYAGEVQALVARVRASAAEIGVAPGRFGILKDAWVTDDGAAGEREREEFLERLRRHYLEEAGSWWVVKGNWPAFGHPELLARQMRRIVESPLVGPAARIVEEVEGLRDSGVDLLVVRLHFDVTRGQASRHATERFAAEVLASLRGRP